LSGKPKKKLPKSKHSYKKVVISTQKTPLAKITANGGVAIDRRDIGTQSSFTSTTP
jgi:hypothetical protein